MPGRTWIYILLVTACSINYIDRVVPTASLAEVTSNFLVVRDTAAGPAIAVAGTYHEVVARSGANWRFKSRQLTHDIAGESGLKPVGL